jgi:hypothetical protein
MLTVFVLLAVKYLLLTLRALTLLLFSSHSQSFFLGLSLLSIFFLEPPLLLFLLFILSLPLGILCLLSQPLFFSHSLPLSFLFFETYTFSLGGSSSFGFKSQTLDLGKSFSFKPLALSFSFLNFSPLTIGFLNAPLHLLFEADVSARGVT